MRAFVEAAHRRHVARENDRVVDRPDGLEGRSFLRILLGHDGSDPRKPREAIAASASRSSFAMARRPGAIIGRYREHVAANMKRLSPH